jgi:hypothetical protein
LVRKGRWAYAAARQRVSALAFTPKRALGIRGCPPAGFRPCLWSDKGVGHTRLMTLLYLLSFISFILYRLKGGAISKPASANRRITVAPPSLPSPHSAALRSGPFRYPPNGAYPHPRNDAPTDDSPALLPSLTPKPAPLNDSQPPYRHHCSLLIAHYSFVHQPAPKDDSPTLFYFLTLDTYQSYLPRCSCVTDALREGF